MDRAVRIEPVQGGSAWSLVSSEIGILKPISATWRISALPTRIGGIAMSVETIGGTKVNFSLC